MSSSDAYEIIDYNRREISSNQVHNTLSNEGTYQEMIENCQQASNHYQELQKNVENKHLDNGMSSNDACASVSTSRAKRRTYCIIVIFLILLISLVLTLGAVILTAVRSELELNKLKDVSNEQDARLMSEIDSLKN